MKRYSVVRYCILVISLILSLLTALFGPAQVRFVEADKPDVCGAPGADGPVTGLSGVVNTYYPGTADVSAGATAIPVGVARAGGGADISTGDLLLVVQMQGADIDASNDERYGDSVGTVGAAGNTVVYSAAAAYAGGNVAANFSAGQYEYVVAAGPIAAGSVPLTSALVNNYFNANFGTQGQRRYQVVRVPQYSNVTLGGTVTALRWDGSTGGIVAFDVAGQLDWNGGTVDVSGMGFRGGGGRQLAGDTTGTATFTDYRTVSSLTVNGSKGEGYAGTPRFVNNNGALLDNGVEGYPNGSYGRGAAGNGGGGSTDGEPSSNRHNSGGGGGGNGGFGGMGGNSWSSARIIGGFGGAPFPGTAPRLILGGGGGAGTTNNATGTPGAGFASSGATGGGVVMVRTGTATGTGSVNANGMTANQTVNNDGGGGGGAGGSVVVIARNGGGNVGTLTVTAQGGNGGDTVVNNNATHHGPGGGGGGGFVFASGALTGASSVAGGLAGLSRGTAPLPTPQNFEATNGGDGVLVTNVTPADIPTAISGANCVPVSPSITKTTSTPVVNPASGGAIGTYTLVVSVPTNSGWALEVEITDNLPSGAPGTITYASTDSVTLSGVGTTRTLTANPVVGTTTPSWGVFDIPPGGSVTIVLSVNISSAVPAGVYQNPAAATMLDPLRLIPTATSPFVYDPASSTGEDIQVGLVAGPTPTPITPTGVPATPVRTPQAVARVTDPSVNPSLLIPVTGFAPGKESSLSVHPKYRTYSSYSDLTLQIPVLGVTMPIVGVPYIDGNWDVTWLGDSAGYLGGTAFPTWEGNSVITGHVYGANGLPGPFVNLGKLKWGHKILVEAFGQVYVYEVRSVYTVRPYDKKPFGHKDEAWVTLITCKQYDEKTDTYRLRTIVQAILISIQDQYASPGNGR